MMEIKVHTAEWREILVRIYDFTKQNSEERLLVSYTCRHGTHRSAQLMDSNALLRMAAADAQQRSTESSLAVRAQPGSAVLPASVQAISSATRDTRRSSRGPAPRSAAPPLTDS